MATSKKAFFKALSSQLSDPIYLTENTDEVIEEIYHNCWAIGAPSTIIKQIKASDLLAFIQNVKDNHQIKLNNSLLDINLIFYMWLDVQAGQLRFNFINSNHNKLPFDCKLKYTDNPEEIVNQFLNYNYHDGIPWDELESIETPEELEDANKLENEIKADFVLTVYQELIKKCK